MTLQCMQNKIKIIHDKITSQGQY